MQLVIITEEILEETTMVTNKATEVWKIPTVQTRI
jgi:hypothetical protein